MSSRQSCPRSFYQPATVYGGGRSTHVVERSSNAWARTDPSVDTAATAIRRALDVNQTLQTTYAPPFEVSDPVISRPSLRKSTAEGSTTRREHPRGRNRLEDLLFLSIGVDILRRHISATPLEDETMFNAP